MAAAAAAESVPVELEAMRKDDHSWHPCQVSLSSDNSTGLLLHFGNYVLDEISTEAEALARLRVRSIPLKNGDCLHVEEEEHVLAMHKTEIRSMFFDAEVVKAWRVRHSNRVHCRCSFEIRWLHPELNGQTMKVPSTSIWKLARNNIHSHPIVAMFLNPSRNSDMPSCVTPLEDAICETNLNSLLEDQIEVISKLADAFDKACSEEFLVGIKSIDIAKSMKRKDVASKKSNLHNVSPYDQNNSRRFTRSQQKLQLETEDKFLPPNHSTPEEHFGKKAYLSPLAARAALASLVHKLPQKPEISICLVDKDVNVNTSGDIPRRDTDLSSLDIPQMFVDSDIGIQEKGSFRGVHSSAAVVPPFPVASDRIQITGDDEIVHEYKSAVSSRKHASKKNRLEGSVEDQNVQEKPTPKLTRSKQLVKDGSLNSNVGTRRLTRSLVQKKMGNSSGEIKAVSSTKDDKLKIPTILTISTSSEVEKENENSIQHAKPGSRVTGNANEDVEIESRTKDGKLDSHVITTRLTRSAVQRKMEDTNNGVEVGSSTRDRNSNGRTITSRLTRLAIQKEIEAKMDKGKVQSSSKGEKSENHNIITRLTCSAVHEEMENSIEQVKMAPSTEHGKLNGPVISKRLTRSAIQKKTGNVIEEQEPEFWTKNMQKRLTRSSLQKEKESLTNAVEVESSTEDGKSNGRSNAITSTHSRFQKEMVNSAEELEIESSTNNGKLNSTIATASTCSSILREMGDSTTEVKKMEEKRKWSDVEGDDITVVDIVTPMIKENKEKKTLSSSLDSKRTAAPRRSVRTKASIPVIIINNDEGETPVCGEGFEIEKQKAFSSKKTQLQLSNQRRFSPRMHARTRS